MSGSLIPTYLLLARIVNPTNASWWIIHEPLKEAKMNNPPTDVDGISSQRWLLCRLELRYPPTYVGGIRYWYPPTHVGGIRYWYPPTYVGGIRYWYPPPTHVGGI